MKNSAILLAAGGGSRMRGTVKDKVLVELFGRPVLWHSARAFIESKCVKELVFVCRDDCTYRDKKLVEMVYNANPYMKKSEMELK